jgi:hypothetical protein
MKTLKLAVMILFMAALWVFNPTALLYAADEEQVEQKICFQWAFGAVVGTGNDQKLESVTRDTPLKTGDQFKMFVVLKKKCFVYVISKNSQGEVIPAGEDKWLRLDGNVGLESFYLLATVKRLTQLEELLDRYESADAPKTPELAERIVTEIRRIRKKHRRSFVAAERPVQIGGSVKKFVPHGKALLFDLSTIAVEVSAVDFFGKTFTIDHR